MTFLSLSQIADRWNVGWDFVHRRRVELGAVRFGKVYRIPETAVEQYERDHAVAEEARPETPKSAPLSCFERKRLARELIARVRA